MNLEKAIEILSIDLGEWTIPFTLDQREALNLGREALERIKSQRNSTKKGGKALLPGETKE